MRCLNRLVEFESHCSYK